MTGGEHHEPHDAFSINFLAIFFHKNIRLETIGSLDELRGRAGMDAELVENGEIFFSHERKAFAWDEYRNTMGRSKAKVLPRTLREFIVTRRDVRAVRISVSSKQKKPARVAGAGFSEIHYPWLTGVD
jgi:hypothetical protein